MMQEEPKRLNSMVLHTKKNHTKQIFRYREQYPTISSLEVYGTEQGKESKTFQIIIKPN